VIRLDYVIDCSALGSTCEAFTLNSYTVGSGSPCALGESVSFTRCNSVFNCDDGDACTTDAVSGRVTSRTCSFPRKNCDDQNVCTVDSRPVKIGLTALRIPVMHAFIVN